MRSKPSSALATSQPLFSSPTRLATRRAHVVEEDLAQLLVAGDVADRPHRHARLAHVDQHEADAGLLLHRLVGAHQREHVGRVEGDAGPDLGAVDDEFVAVDDAPRYAGWPGRSRRSAPSSPGTRCARPTGSSAGSDGAARRCRARSAAGRCSSGPGPSRAARRCAPAPPGRPAPWTATGPCRPTPSASAGTSQPCRDMVRYQSLHLGPARPAAQVAQVRAARAPRRTRPRRGGTRRR